MQLSRLKFNFWIFKDTQFVLSLFFVIAILLTYSFFPTEDKFQQFFTPFVFFILIPFLYSKLILKRDITKLGITLGNYRQGLIFSSVSLLVAVLILWIISKNTPLLSQYLIPTKVSGDFGNFLFYEFVTTLFFVVLYEFFFRGFLMLLFEKKNGYWSIFFQYFIFVIMVLSIGQNFWNFIPYLVFGLFSGLIVNRSRSILYSSCAQLLLIMIMDVAMIKIVEK